MFLSVLQYFRLGSKHSNRASTCSFVIMMKILLGHCSNTYSKAGKQGTLFTISSPVAAFGSFNKMHVSTIHQYAFRTIGSHPLISVGEMGRFDYRITTFRNDELN